MVKEKKKIEINWELVLMGCLIVILVVPIVFLISVLCVDYHDEHSSKMTLRHCNHYYYVNSCTEAGDYITAIDINGRKIILPKNDTIIECRGE